MMQKGKVFLVGAGPGDPGLITVKGMNALKKADAVVYDRLASPRLLRELRPDAEKIYVGKLPDRHTMAQEDINQLLVDLALEGKLVVRLKGGDPCVFGRVGEEAGLLVENGIEFDIVPGITSALAVPAYAGIPTTHRDFNSSFSIITGHEKPEKLKTTIRWDKLALATETLVFLMGVAKVRFISEQLIDHGKTPDTPVALIRWGTRIEQETLTGTLETIADQVEQANFQPPAIILVGEVVKLREKLQWFETKPLFGKRVLVTRARSQASSLVEQIDELGGEPVEFPVIKTEAAPVTDLTEKVIEHIGEYSWIVFTSPNGVNYFFDLLKSKKTDIRSIGKAKLACVGPQTAETLESKGLFAISLPEQFHADSLAEHLIPQIKADETILLARGNLGRKELPELLGDTGASVTDLPVYETTPTQEAADEVISMLKSKKIDIITFTSSSTVNNLYAVLSKAGEDAAALINTAAVACIGPVTADTAKQLGLRIDITAKEATIPSLIEAISQFREEFV